MKNDGDSNKILNLVPLAKRVFPNYQASGFEIKAFPKRPDFYNDRNEEPCTEKLFVLVA